MLTEYLGNLMLTTISPQEIPDRVRRAPITLIVVKQDGCPACDDQVEMMKASEGALKSRYGDNVRISVVDVSKPKDLQVLKQLKHTGQWKCDLDAVPINAFYREAYPKQCWFPGMALKKVELFTELDQWTRKPCHPVCQFFRTLGWWGNRSPI